ncbi:hypothetical protein [Streptomyces roseoviridis]|uniref:hypothetical protein n=1 Tax=Streptomyces roseoviridis TaxID=67361 RepID=UPI0031E6A17E
MKTAHTRRAPQGTPPRRELAIAAAIPEYLRAEAAVLVDSLIPLVNRFRARQSDDGTVPAPDEADRTLLLRIRREGAAWYRRHALDDQAAALEADIDGWLAAGLDSRPRFGRCRAALPGPAAGETVFLLGPGLGAGAGPAGGGRLDCCFALYAQAPSADSGSSGDGPVPVLIAGSERAPGGRVGSTGDRVAPGDLVGSTGDRPGDRAAAAVS